VDAVDDVGVLGDDVAVGEGEYGVQAHGGPQLGHAGDDHPLGGAVGEQRRRDLGDGLAGGALAHAQQQPVRPAGEKISPIRVPNRVPRRRSG
jgi:hypothetical protein